MGNLIRRYLVVFEQRPATWRGFAPDVPVCVESGLTLEDLRERMHDAIEAYLRGRMLRGQTIPEPSMRAEDFQKHSLAEWMVIRLRDGGNNNQHLVVRPCPSR